MKFVRPIYFVFVFAVVWLLTFRPDRLRNAPRPLAEQVVKFGIGLAIAIASGHLATRTAAKDWRTLRGGTNLEKEVPLNFNSTEPMLLDPIRGEGPCQVRLVVHRLSPTQNADEVEICAVDQAGRIRGQESLGFEFGKEHFEVAVPDPGAWALAIKIRFTSIPHDAFTGKVRVRIQGSARNIQIADEFVPASQQQ